VATYTVKDTLGLTDTGTLTITAAPEPLSFKIEGASTVNEDGAITFTVTANEAVTAATEVVFTLVPGDNAAADQGTATTNLNDFSQGSFNPVTVVIPADGTKATFSITPPNDDLTELAESFSVQAVVGSQTLTATASLLDGASGGGKTYMLTKDQDIIPGTAGNDTVNGLIDLVAGTAVTEAGTSTTFNGFDQINGAAGTNTFKLAVSGSNSKGDYDVSLANIEKIQVVEINTPRRVVTQSPLTHPPTPTSPTSRSPWWMGRTMKWIQVKWPLRWQPSWGCAKACTKALPSCLNPS